MATTTWTKTLADGYARLVGDAGLGVYLPDGGVLPADQVAVTLKAKPEAPDACIVVSPYTVTDSTTGNAVQGVQFLCRGDRGDRFGPDALADALYDLLHGREGYYAGTLWIANSWRQSHAPLGADADDRWETTSNFYLNAAHPNTFTR